MPIFHMSKNEVNREILAILLVVIILISILGTWTVLHLLDQKKPILDTTTGAFVSLEVLPSDTPVPSPLSGDER